MSFLDKVIGAVETVLPLDKLLDLVLQRFPVLQKLFDLAKKIIEHFTGTIGAGVHLVDAFQTEFQAIKNFKEDIRIKSRVINIERAVTKIRELVQGIFDSYHAVLDLIKNITTKLEVGGVAEIAEAATGIGLPVALVNAIVLIVEVLDTIRNVIDDLQTVLDEITRVRKAIETADTIFLSQSNPRKIVKLADGGSVKIRVGKLHPA